MVKRKPIKKPETHEGLEILMIPVEDLIPDEDNPNEMDEATFDQLCEEIREQGFDEPIHVRPSPSLPGKYEIGSGHHRTKAAMVNGLTAIPAVIKHWTDREKKVALTKRNVLRGNMNKQKLTKLYRDLAKDSKDPALLQRELGFTDTKAFEAMIEKVESQLPPKQRKKLAEAKEHIKSIDDLSSVLNRIFKEAGSELDKGYMVFSFGGKKHHYFQIDAATNDKLEAIIAAAEANGTSYTEVMQSIVAAVDVRDLPKVSKPATTKASPKKNPKRRRKV